MPKKISQSHQFLTFNITILKLMGLWLENKKERDDKMRYCKQFSVFLFLSASMIPLFCEFITVLIDPEPNIVEKIQVILAETCVFGATYMVICFMQHRSDIKDLVESIEEFKQYSNQDATAVDQKVGYFSKIAMAYSLIGTMIYTLSPLLSKSSCEITKAQYKIDHNIPCGVMVPIRIPFKLKNSFAFTFWVISESVTAGSVVLIVTSISLLICGLLQHIVTQLKEVRSYILKLSLADAEEIEDVTKFAVEYHNKVVEFIEKLNRYFGSQLVLHFTLTSVVISLLGFEILMVDDNKESVMYALHLIGWLIMLYTICFYGQLLIDESIGIAEDAYCTPWYNSPVKIQKDIKLIILRAQKPLTLKALNLGIMSHPTFLGVISSAYSYFTLLLKVKNS